jgi:hypothetical protein
MKHTIIITIDEDISVNKFMELQGWWYLKKEIRKAIIKKLTVRCERTHVMGVKIRR